jgi:hypothetical protein
MMATAHTLVAGAIAAKVGNPALTIPLALTSHFLLDSIPHWDFGTNWRNRTKLITGIYACVDTVFGITWAYYLFHTKVTPIVLIPTLIVSVLPDWLEAPWYILYANPNHSEPSKNASLLEQFVYRTYKATNVVHSKAPFPWGLISQIVTVIFFLLILQ